MPQLGAIGAVSALIFAVLSLILPLVLKFFTIPLVFVSLAVAGLAFYYGDELPWLGVMWRGRIENNRLSSELFEEET